MQELQQVSPGIRTGAPKISCLMVTRGALYPARFAIECYQRQTYRNRELVVVCDVPGAEIAGWIAGLGDESIRYVETDKAVLGALRNVSVAAARGDLVCQWDDDDLCHPKRLEVQRDLMRKAGAGAHFLSQWMLWWPERRLLGLSALRPWEGTMLARREIMPPYPEIPLREDAAVVAEILKNNRVTWNRRPTLYCYVFHGGNSWDRSHFEMLFERASLRIAPEDYDQQLLEMANLFPFEDYTRWLDETGQILSDV
jgi:glycosyltransferase involved in cell wall biosynthesis